MQFFQYLIVDIELCRYYFFRYSVLDENLVKLYSALDDALISLQRCYSTRLPIYTRISQI